MHYFSIHDQDGGHVGFLVLSDDDETQQSPQSGRFVVKVAEQAPQGAAKVLQPFEQTDIPQYWRANKDRIELFFDDANIGTLRLEYLTVSGQTFVLTDLTGAL